MRRGCCLLLSHAPKPANRQKSAQGLPHGAQTGAYLKPGFGPSLGMGTDRGTNAPTRCPRCESQRIKRNGHIGGVQYFYCHHCRRSFNARTGHGQSNIRLRVEYQQFVASFSEVRPLRQDAARLGISVATAWRWRHRVLHCMAQEQAAAGPHLQGEVVVHSWTIDRERSYWSWWVNVYWHRFRGPLCKTPPRSEPTTVLFVASTAPLEPPPFTTGSNPFQPHPSSESSAISNANGPPKLPDVVHAMCYAVPGIPGRSDFSTLMPKILKPGGVAQTVSGRLQILHEDENPPTQMRDLVFDEDNNPLFMPEYFYRGRVKWAAFGSKRPVMDRTRLLKVRHAFLHWMMRFRGVAVKYLDRYVAWYNAAVANTPALFQTPKFMT